MNPETRERLYRFGVQMVIYAVLVSIYLYLVWRYLEDWLVHLYREDLPLYAVICLVFIVVQAVILDTLTTFIMDRLNLYKKD
jgi:hypothetical protein